MILRLLLMNSQLLILLVSSHWRFSLSYSFCHILPLWLALI